MAWIHVNDFRYPGGWVNGNDPAAMARAYCEKLEGGGILFFDSPPFNLPDADREFLLSQKQSGFKGHKNISYRPKTDVLRGDAGETPEDSKRLQEVMRNFSSQVIDFASKFLAPYAKDWIIDFASFRSVEEQNRDLSLHKRNDLLHVDAFPSRPTHGGRILRIFTNINPSRPRVWETTEGFETLAKSFADDAGLKKFAEGAASPLNGIMKTLAPVLKTVGVKGADRSAYDKFMLRFHDYLKENNDYQQKWAKTRIEFPPGSCWLVYTDTVPHAVMSGQYAMEQTFIIPLKSMVAPQRAPIRVLEGLCGKKLAS